MYITMSKAPKVRKKIGNSVREFWAVKRQDLSKPIHGCPPFWLSRTANQYVFNDQAALMRRMVDATESASFAITFMPCIVRPPGPFV